MPKNFGELSGNTLRKTLPKISSNDSERLAEYAKTTAMSMNEVAGSLLSLAKAGSLLSLAKAGERELIPCSHLKKK